MKTVSLAVFLLALLAPNARAEAAKKKASPAAAREDSGAPLPTLEASSAPVTVADIMRRFEDFEGRLKSLTAEFDQTVHLQEAGSRSVRGSLSYQRPRSLRIEHVLPSRQSLIASGNTLWIHRHENNQVIQSTLDDWRKAEPLASSLIDFSSYSVLLKNYDVSIDCVTPTGDGHRGIALRLLPRTPRRDFELTLRLDTRDYFPSQAELSVGATRITTRFSKIVLNPELSAKLFDFKPPPDAEIFMNFKPPISR